MIASPSLNLTNPKTPSSATDHFYDGCAETKGCFGCDDKFECAGATSAPEGCFSSKDCAYLVTYKADGENREVQFEFLRTIVNVTDRHWIGVGVNDNTTMVDTNAFIFIQISF
jgi:hypothetical protein